MKHVLSLAYIESFPTNVESEFDFKPKEFSLFQNYPNPFNPSTTIDFQISSSAFVSLKVYDALGNQVAVLLQQELQPGIYKTQFNSNNLSSGIYF